MFVTLKSKEKEMTKHFTISSSPTEKHCLEFTKKLTGHEFSNALDALKVGDEVVLNAPFGQFTFQGEFEKLAMLTGGIGITPLRSICKYCTDKRLSTDIILLYSNHREEDVAFGEELEEMQRQNKNFRLVVTLTKPSSEWAGKKGRINTDLIRLEIPDYQERVFYVSGPTAMVEAMEAFLQELEVSPERIKKDKFPGY